MFGMAIECRGHFLHLRRCKVTDRFPPYMTKNVHLRFLRQGRNRRGPARTEEVGFGDAGNGHGIGLVASQHVEMLVLLADRAADLTDGTAFENQHPASDGLHCLLKQEPVSGSIGIGA